MYLPRGVYLPGGVSAWGCTCQRGILAWGVPACGCTCPGGVLGVVPVGGVPARGCTCPRECTCPGGVPAQGGVPTWVGYLPGGVPAQGECTCPGVKIQTKKLSNCTNSSIVKTMLGLFSEFISMWHQKTNHLVTTNYVAVNQLEIFFPLILLKYALSFTYRNYLKRNTAQSVVSLLTQFTAVSGVPLTSLSNKGINEGKAILTLSEPKALY